MEKIKVFGTPWCGDCRRTRKILDDRAVDYEWIDINQDKAGEKFVIKTNQGNRSVPTILFPDETILVEPSNAKLSEKLDALEF